jgi:hypothetical protein
MFYKLRRVQPTVAVRFSDKALHFPKPSRLTPAVSNFGVIGWCKLGCVMRQVFQTLGLDSD